MYVGLDENGGVDTRYEDTNAEKLMKHPKYALDYYGFKQPVIANACLLLKH